MVNNMQDIYFRFKKFITTNLKTFDHYNFPFFRGIYYISEKNVYSSDLLHFIDNGESGMAKYFSE
jgi:hypothetical protein